ncbi:HTTM domain-containing protein [Streptomyces sp. bgisy100]|uniref:HTTM domain-containing protein n=1 Tax=Streptomyces sp. bgisy100 TaxID=3413783 RepID=UPI003D7066DB
MSTDQAAASPEPREPAPPGPARGRLDGLTARIADALCTARAPYQAAVIRVGFAALFAAFLLREWPHRRVLYGDHSPLSWEMTLTLVREDHNFTVLSWWGGHLWFELVYHLTIATALAVMLGWRTRTMTVLFMVGVLSLENRNTFVGDGGDNVIRIMVIYLVFTRCAQVWSLDARRARSRTTAFAGDRVGVALWAALGMALMWAFGPQAAGWPLVFWVLWAVHGIWYAANRWFPAHEARAVLDSCAAMLHNTTMLVIAAQVCLIYATAGWYKIQGSRWQEGSALYYALHLDHFTPWPWLAGLLAANTLMALALSYITVMVQVAFPFSLANRKIKNILLVAMMLEHAGIAIILGIPLLSLAMIVCDAVFLPTSFLLWLGAHCTRATRRTTGRGPGKPLPQPAIGAVSGS